MFLKSGIILISEMVYVVTYLVKKEEIKTQTENVGSNSFVQMFSRKASQRAFDEDTARYNLTIGFACHCF